MTPADAALETKPAALAALAAVRQEERRRRLTPPPKLTVSEWADAKRFLSREASAEPGRWSTDRAPYQRGIMDALSDPGIETVVVMSASQVGKTEFELNAVGYFADQDPAPMLVVLPTIEEAEQWSKTRLAPMIRDTPTLRDRFRDPKSKDSGNTLRVKEFPGGHITLVGANSAAGLAAKPIRVVLGDEVDRWPASAGTEGDPMMLAAKRTTTFWNRKLLWVSTPTIEGASRIHQAYLEGDRRRFWLPCPSCGTFQTLAFGNLRGDRDAAGIIVPESVRYPCTGCGVLWEEHDKAVLLAGGEWRAEAPTERVASFHLSALYSPWTSWASVQADYNASRHDLSRLQVWTNTVLGEPWQDRRGGMDAGSFEDRVGVGYPEPPAEVPDAAALLTMGVDVQDDRVEFTVWGWGAGMSRYRITHQIVPCDPSQPGAIEQAVEPWRTKGYLRADGTAARVYATGVDSGAHTDAVYRYCRPRFGARVYALKGSSTPGAPLAPRRGTRNNKGGLPLFLVGTEAAKDDWYGALRVAVEGPGYVAFDRGAESAYFEQLVAESVVRKQVAGRWYRRYELPRGKRAEALDCAVYALAALHISGYPRERLGAGIRRPAGEPHPSEEPPHTLPPAAPEQRPNIGQALALQRRFKGRWR